MQCKAKKTDGQKCSANAMDQKNFCFFHSPEEAKRREAQSRGGKANLITVKEPLPPIAIKDTQDVVGLLEETINQVRAGAMDVKVANCIGVLSGQIIKALEVNKIAHRVELIEQVILKR